MARATNGTIHKNRRKKTLKAAKGFRGGRSKLYETAKSATMKAGLWAWRDRRAKKRDFRALWIAR
ncbi:MAG TPA: 50S ribosomal protein L20, partial [Leptospiraceae bacterium]|nr:50S ribosomal protein L20 [Leptospiraceae bacterium]